MALLLIFLIHLAFASAICPDKETLEDIVTFPEIGQIDSQHVFVNWTRLWPEVSWSDCFSSAVIVINDRDVVDVEDLSVKAQKLKVPPCQEVRVLIEITLMGTSEDVQSMPSERDFQTFQGPKGKILSLDSAKEVITYKQHFNDTLDLSTIQIETSFLQVVEDPTCHRVARVELRYRVVGTDLWNVVKSMDLFNRLKEEITGLDLCSEYEVALELIGTTGTEPTTVILGRIGPPTKEIIRKAVRSKFNYEPPSPHNITLSETSAISTVVQWTMPNLCFHGVNVTVMSSVSGKLVQEKNETSHTELSPVPDGQTLMTTSLKDLTPCQDYTVLLESYFTIDLKKGLFYRSNPTSLPEIRFTTRPDFSGEHAPFDLKSLRSKRQGNSMNLSWSRNEWPCLEPKHYNVWICSKRSTNQSSSTWSDAKSSESLFDEEGEETEYEEEEDDDDEKEEIGDEQEKGEEEEEKCLESLEIISDGENMVVKFEGVDTCNTLKVMLKKKRFSKQRRCPFRRFFIIRNEVI